MIDNEITGPRAATARVSSRSAELLRLLSFSITIIVAAWVGRATFLDSAGFSLVWPASGIGIIWIASSNRRRILADLTMLALVTGLTVLVVGASAGDALLSAVLAVLQPLVFVAVMRRLAPDLWGSGGSRPLGRVADIPAFLLAAAVAAAATSVVRWSGLGLVAPGEPIELLEVWVRNLAWMVAVTSVALQLAPSAVVSDSLSDLMRRMGRALVAPGRGRGAEVVLIVVVTAVVYVAVFWRSSEIPSTFLLVLATVWAATRLSPVASSLQALVSGTAAVLFTLDERGALASLSEPRWSALLAQLFLIVLSITALALAFSVSDRLEATARATASKEAGAEWARLLGAVLESMQEGVEVVRDDGKVLVRNHAASRILGLSGPASAEVREGEQSEPSTCSAVESRLLNSDRSRVSHERLPSTRALAGERVIAEDYWIRHPHGPRDRILEVTAVPLPSVTSRARHRVVITFRDVTADRRERDDLASFAGVIAHDLLNPLGVVSGWTDMLDEAYADGAMDQVQGREILHRIHDGTQRMQRLIEDLLEYTLARDRALDLREVDLSALAEQVADEFREDVTGPVIDIQPGMYVQGDEILLRQLIDNLISNAVKYVAPGVQPCIEMSAESRGSRLEITLTDNGIGVPPEHRERIFDDFHRAHPDGYTGSGIGLAICRRVVVRHEGTIRVLDGPRAQGSAFVFTLQRSPA